MAKKPKPKKLSPGKTYGPNPTYGEEMTDRITVVVTAKQKQAAELAAKQRADEISAQIKRPYRVSISDWAREIILAALPPEVSEVPKQSE
jgi:hypothetical protein